MQKSKIKIKDRINTKIFHFGLSFCILIFTFLILSSSASAGTIIKAPAYLGLSGGLVGYWTFDGADTHTSGKTDDKSGNGNVGTLVNSPTRTIGKIGQALSLNSTSTQYVTAGNNPTSATAITYIAWVKFASFPTAYNTVMGKNGGGCNYSDMHVTSTGQLAIYVCGNSDIHYDATGTHTLSAGTWYQLAMTYDSVRGLIGYVNGEVDNTVAPNGALAANSATLSVGNDLQSSPRYVNGIIDDVHLYSRALSSNEISRLYRIGLGSSINHSRSASGSDNGLVGYWTFDGADTHSNGVTDDKSGFGNNGTLTGANGLPTRTIGKVGQALNFDGVDDYVNIGDPAILKFTTQNFTICGWVNARSAPAGGPAAGIIARADDNVGVTRTISLEVAGTTNSGKGTFQLFDGTNNPFIRTPSSLAGTGWRHMCGVRVSGNIRLFLDGSEVSGSPATDTAGNVDTSGLTWAIGERRDNGLGANLDGLIDDVRIYNRALSAGEIQNLYNETQSKFNSSKTNVLTSGLASYWTFDGIDTHSNGITDDKSGNGYQGTLTGSNGLPTRTIGKVGQALLFHYAPIDNFSRVALSPGITLSDTNTVSMWIYRNDVFSGDTFLGLFGEYAYAGQISIFYRKDTDKISFNYPVAHYNNTVISHDTWHHIVVVSNAGNVTFYLDGQADGTATGAPGYTADSIGNVNSAIFEGKIDDVRIYNRALSDGEVMKLYNMGR